MELGLRAIKANTFFQTKTVSYLSPMFVYYGPEFMSRIRSIVKIAIGIDDIKYSSVHSLDSTDMLFVLADKNRRINKAIPFSKSLDYLRNHKSYVTDYPYMSLDYSGRYYMIVLKLPKEFINPIDTFRNSEYSKLYTKEQVDRCFNGFYNTIPYKVITKDRIYAEEFADHINTAFRTTIPVKEFIKKELDTPIKLENQVFNYSEEKLHNTLNRLENEFNQTN